MRNLKKYIKENKLMNYFIGLVIMTLGINLFYLSNLGAGPWDSLNYNLSIILNISIGLIIVIEGIIILSLIAMFKKERVMWKSFISLVIIGFMMNIWHNLLIVNFIVDIKVGTELFLFITGLIFFTFGVTLYIRSTIPPQPIDNIMIFLSERFNISLGMGKLVDEIIAITLLFITIIYLNQNMSEEAQFGIGTIVIAYSLGYFINISNVVLDKFKI